MSFEIIKFNEEDFVIKEGDDGDCLYVYLFIYQKI